MEAEGAAFTGRFDHVRELGRGGMGVVYEVLDRQRGLHVALKTLYRVASSQLMRLKREFRAAADVSHPHLVSLYELFVDADKGWFTMELVRGVDIVRYARPGDGGAQVEAIPTLSPGSSDLAAVLAELTPPTAGGGGAQDTRTLASIGSSSADATAATSVYRGRHAEALELASSMRHRMGALRRAAAVLLVVASVNGIAGGHVGDEEAIRWGHRTLVRATKRIPNYRGLARYLHAMLQWLRGDREAALAEMLSAAEDLDAVGLTPQIAAGMRYTVGRVQGGSEGEALVRAAEARMARAGVRRPRRILEIFAPAAWLGRQPNR